MPPRKIAIVDSEGRPSDPGIVILGTQELGLVGDAVSEEILLLVSSAESLTISNQGEYDAANALFQQVAKLRKRIDNARLDRTRPLDAAKKSIMELFAPLGAQLDAGSLLLKQGITNYEADREAERILAQRQLQLAAEAEAEATRKKLRDDAETRLAATPDVADEDEHYRAWQEAEWLREQAEAVTVRTDIQQATPGFQSAAGTGHRTYWRYRIEEPERLPREYLMPDEKAIRDRVSRDKGNTNIPGVVVFDDPTIFATGR